MNINRTLNISFNIKLTIAACYFLTPVRYPIRAPQTALHIELKALSVFYFDSYYTQSR